MQRKEAYFCTQKVQRRSQSYNEVLGSESGSPRLTPLLSKPRNSNPVNPFQKVEERERVDAVELLPAAVGEAYRPTCFHVVSTDLFTVIIRIEDTPNSEAAAACFSMVDACPLVFRRYFLRW